MKGTLRPFSIHSVRGADGAIPLLYLAHRGQSQTRMGYKKVKTRITQARQTRGKDLLVR